MSFIQSVFGILGKNIAASMVAGAVSIGGAGAIVAEQVAPITSKPSVLIGLQSAEKAKKTEVAKTISSVLSSQNYSSISSINSLSSSTKSF